MIPPAVRREVMRALIEGTELRLYTALDGAEWSEPIGYQPVPIAWLYGERLASADHRIEFDAPAGEVVGWLAVRDGAARIIQRFADGPYEIRIAGDAIRVQPAVTLDIDG